VELLEQAAKTARDISNAITSAIVFFMFSS
jgi:hypothetical protein